MKERRPEDLSDAEVVRNVRERLENAAVYKTLLGTELPAQTKALIEEALRRLGRSSDDLRTECTSVRDLFALLRSEGVDEKLLSRAERLFVR